MSKSTFVPALSFGPNSVSVEQGDDALIVRVWRRDGTVVSELRDHRMLVPYTAPRRDGDG